MIRVGLFLAFLFAAVSASAQSGDFVIPCSDAPKEAVLTLPDPLNKWGSIYCTIYGHVIAAKEGYIWSFPGAFAPVHFPAQMVRTDPKEVRSSVYFSDISITTLSHDEGERINDQFTGQLSVQREPVEHVYRMTAKNNVGGQHVAYFLEFPKDIWGLWCNERCGRTPPFMLLNMQQPR